MYLASGHSSSRSMRMSGMVVAVQLACCQSCLLRGVAAVQRTRPAKVSRQAAVSIGSALRDHMVIKSTTRTQQLLPAPHPKWASASNATTHPNLQLQFCVPTALCAAPPSPTHLVVFEKAMDRQQGTGSCSTEHTGTICCRCTKYWKRKEGLDINSVFRRV